MKTKNTARAVATSILKVLLLAAIAFAILYPLLFMVMTAFKTPRAFVENFWLPPTRAQFTLENLREVWFNYGFTVFFRNSVIVSLSAASLTLVIALPAGYAFAKLKFPFSEKVFFLILSVMFLPVFVYILPLFVQMRRLDLTNTYASLILVYIFFSLPKSIYISRNFFHTIPEELSESALVDGAGQLRIFRQIVLPLAKPIVSCVAILAFVVNWGEYIWVTVSSTKDAYRTIPSALSYFTSLTNVFWWYQMAALTVATIPLILMYLLLNKMFIRGLTEGALKG